MLSRYYVCVALPTVAEVKALPLGAALLAAFADVADAHVQEQIDLAASWFGSPDVLQHTQRDKAVKYCAAHLLWLALDAEGLAPGGNGGGAGVVSGRSLDGAGSISYAVQAQSPEQTADPLLQWSPFLTRLQGILDTFPPGIMTAHESPG